MTTTRGDHIRSRRDERYQDDTYDDDTAYDDEPYDDDPDGAELAASDAARTGLGYVAELTGKPPTGITSLERGESGWVVGVEVIDDRRIPSSGDMLAEYRVELDADGDLRGYRRLRRYPRGRGDSTGAG